MTTKKKLTFLASSMGCLAFEMEAQPAHRGPSAVYQARDCVLRFLPLKDKRTHTFSAALELFKRSQGKTIVETGTARGGRQNLIGDGGSSLIFARWVGWHGGEFYSVDIDPVAVATAESASFASSRSHFVCGDSIEFLKNFQNQIDLLYLDSYDYEMENPEPSQQHHLNEILAAYDKLHDQSIVLIDDCDLEGGGKGRLVIGYLQNLGWKVLLAGYQTLLVKNCFR